eukprot:6348768-Amphidinium_carterae.1
MQQVATECYFCTAPCSELQWALAALPPLRTDNCRELERTTRSNAHSEQSSLSCAGGCCAALMRSVHYLQKMCHNCW